MVKGFYSRPYWHNNLTGQMLWSLRRITAIINLISIRTGYYAYPHISFIPMGDNNDTWSGWYVEWSFEKKGIAFQIEYSFMDGLSIWGTPDVGSSEASTIYYCFEDKFLLGDIDLESKLVLGGPDDEDASSWSELETAIEASIAFLQTYPPKVRDSALESVFGLI